MTPLTVYHPTASASALTGVTMDGHTPTSIGTLALTMDRDAHHGPTTEDGRLATAAMAIWGAVEP